MKKEIHPTLHDLKAECACVSKIQTRSTQKEIKVEICSACHPFCTGTQKFVDTAGRIEKFQARYKQNKKAKK